MTVVIDSWDCLNLESTLDCFSTNSLDVYKKNLHFLRRKYELLRAIIYLDIDYYRYDVDNVDESSLFIFMLSNQLIKLDALIDKCSNHNLNLSPEYREMQVLWDNLPTDPDSVISIF